MIPLPLDYEILRLIWWALLGVLLIGFAVTDGFDLGVGALLPFVARSDGERRVVINTVGPVWEGNQVWFILGGGAIFAAFPAVYAVAFSGFYLAMFLLLVALILRPVGFKYRSKIIDDRWRNTWDWALFVGGFVPALVFGVAVGNMMLGVPFRFDGFLRSFYEGTLWGLFTPFPLLCGLLSVSMLVMHGASYLATKTSGPVNERARTYGAIAALVTIVLFAGGGAYIALGIDGYVITSVIDPNGPSNPLLKTVVLQTGGWMSNYAAHSWMLVAPVLGFVGAALALIGLATGRAGTAIVGSGVSVAGIIATVGVSTFPFILPSSLDSNASLTVWDATSSQTTLFIMTIVAAIFTPLVLLYTAWVYKVLWGKVGESDIQKNSGAFY
jgi:cytochrome bd ubiquinol oxidase subunit II